MTVPGIVAVNHVGISVADLAAARAFWIDGLGARDHGGWSWPVGTAPADESLATDGTAASVQLLRTDTAFLELFEFSAPVPARRAESSPGVSEVTWAVADVGEAAERACAAGGRPSAGQHPDVVLCPDGTPVRLVPTGRGDATGPVGLTVRVPEPDAHPVRAVPGPVRLDLLGGAVGVPARPVDLGVNHVCLDVAGIAAVRASLSGVRWHHDVTESSGGIAAVCYGTTHDGVLVELLESRSDEAFLALCRLPHG
jgi:catechol 2,3-dioxygenase-like lactoylglutathione lyase family enzyme